MHAALRLDDCTDKAVLTNICFTVACEWAAISSGLTGCRWLHVFVTP